MTMINNVFIRLVFGGESVVGDRPGVKISIVVVEAICVAGQATIAIEYGTTPVGHVAVGQATVARVVEIIVRHIAVRQVSSWIQWRIAARIERHISSWVKRHISSRI